MSAVLNHVYSPDRRLARHSLCLAEVAHRHSGRKKRRRKKSASSNESGAKGITRPLTGVLVPTLRLKPFSITEISADVALAGLDPFQLLGGPPCLQVQRLGTGSFCQDPLISQG